MSTYAARKRARSTLVIPPRKIPASDADVAVALQMPAVVFVAGNFLELRTVFGKSLDRPANVRPSIDAVERLAGDKYADGLFALTHAHVEAYASIDVFEQGRARN